jgi:RimJ/RimL family protein N-acetyltransferase
MPRLMASDELLTPRLRLRWLSEDDAGPMLSIWNDPDFIRHVGDRGIRTVSEAGDALRNGVLRLYADHGYGPYLLEPIAGGVPMGICGLFKRDNLEHPDLGYSLLPGFRGRGYGLEAAREVVRHARDDLGLPELLAIVSPGNTPSTRLLEKLGMQPGGTLRMPGADRDVHLYRVVLGGPPGE